MSEDIRQLCELVLLEIESMQKQLNQAVELAQQLADQHLLAEFERMQRDLDAARERLLAKMREGQ